MAQTFTKNKLSGSTNGRNIKLTGTSTGSTVVIHTAVSGTVNFDEIFIFANNTSTSAVLLTLEYGATISPDDDIKVSIPAESGEMLVVPGLLLQNGGIVKAFASSANVINLNGYVHNIVNT